MQYTHRMAELVPRLLYAPDPLDQLGDLIRACVQLGIRVPPGMPVDTPEHVRAALSHVGYLLMRGNRDEKDMW